MPDIGVIKAGDSLAFKILYSPTNLKEHCAVLKISNKFEEHIYNFKGKQIRSHKIEFERTMKIKQGKKSIEIILVPIQGD